MSNKTQILIAAVIAGLFAIGIVVSDGSNGAKLPPPAPSSIDIW